MTGKQGEGCKVMMFLAVEFVAYEGIRSKSNIRSIAVVDVVNGIVLLFKWHNLGNGGENMRCFRCVAAITILCAVISFAGCSKQVNGKELKLDLGNDTILETFSGTLKNGKPCDSGKAVLVTDNITWEYEGSFNQNGLHIGVVTGMPTSLNVNGRQIEGIYSGETIDLEMAGSGVFSASDGSGFECSGIFDLGQISVWQEYDVKNYYSELSMGGKIYAGVYNGGLNGGKPNGNGSFTAADVPELVCTGSFVDGQLSATEASKVNGLPYSLPFEGQTLNGTYEGELLGDMPHGTGTFSYSEGEDRYAYTGDWASGIPAGKGKLNTNLYVVHFEEFDRTGSYDGETLDGMASGAGTFSAVTDENVSYTYEGQWSDGLWNGQGAQIYDNSDQMNRIGTFLDGKFTPTFKELLISYGTATPEFSMSEERLEAAEQFCFGMGHDELASSTDENLRYEQYIKSPGSYTDSLMYISDYHVVQISEWTEKMLDNAGNPYDQQITEMIIEDANYDHVCWVEFFGSLDGLYEGYTLSLRGFPMAYSSYKSVEDVTIKCIVMLGLEVSY